MASQLAKVVMTLDGKRVEVGLDKIREKTKQLKKEMHDLAMAGKQNSKEFKDRQKAVEKLHKAEEEVVDVTKRINQYMKNLGDVATKDLRRAYREGVQLREGFKGTDKQLQKLNADLAKMDAQIKKNTASTSQMVAAQKGFSGALGTTLKNLTAYVGVFAAFNWVKGKVTEIFKGNLKLSDSLTDIRKVSGLTIQEVDKLQASLMKIDTRASVEELDKLAYAGAKLGMGQYGVAGLASFVRAANKVNVALKEDLGEDALTAMSKLVEVMGLIPKLGIEKSMDAAGSAIFTLSTSSTATGRNIIEMSKRLMGLANVSHITTAELLALSSASDTMGLMPEVSATAFNKLFTSIQTNTKKIEKSLEMQQGTLRTMIDEGRTMDAIVTVFDKMNKLGRMDAMKPLFKDLGSDGARLNAVMTTMASKVDILKNHIDMSNQSFKDATAIQKEYLMQQESAQGYMERATNIWSKAFINPEGVNTVKQLAQEWYNLSKALTSDKIWMGEVQMSLTILKKLIETLLKLLPVLTTYLMMYGVARTVYGVVAAYNALKVSILGARAATMALTTAQKASGWGALLTIIALGISYFLDYGDAAEEAADAQTQFNEAVSEAQSIHAKQTKKLDEYIKKLEGAAGSEEERNRIMDKFNREFGTYLNKLGIEIKTVDDLKTHYAALNEELRKKAFYEQGERLRQDYVGAAEQKQTEAMGKMMDLADKYGFSQDIIFDVTSGSNAFADEAYVFQRLYNEMYGKEFGVNGKLRWKKNNPYQYVIGEGDTRSVKPLTGGSEKTEEIYNAVMDLVNSSRDVLRRTQRVEDFMNEYAKGYEPMSIGIEPMNGTATNIETKEEKKERLSRLKVAFKQAKEDVDGVIAKIDQWYNLQEAAIKELRADNKITEEEMTQALDEMEQRRHTALMLARRSLSTGTEKAKKEWDDYAKNKLPKDMVDSGAWSTQLMNDIMDVNVKALHDYLKQFNGLGDFKGMDGSAFLDGVGKKAAEDKLKVQSIRAKTTDRITKMLSQYHYVDLAQQQMQADLEQIGFMSETYEQWFDRLRSGRELTDEEKATRRGNYNAMGEKFISQGTIPFTIDIENQDEALSWIRHFATDAGGELENWAKTFPQIIHWLDLLKQKELAMAAGNDTGVQAINQSIKETMPEIQSFYETLMQWEGRYYDATKKSYQLLKKRFDEAWEISGKGKAFSNALQGLDMRKRQLSLNGSNKGTNFMDIAGFDELNEDPEIAQSLLRMQQAREELETLKQINAQKKLEGEALAAHQQLMHEKEQAMAEAEMAMQEQLMKSINDRISKLQEWTAPIEAFGTEVGQALYDQWHNGESMSAKWQDMLKKMGLAWGQLTVKIVSELMMQRIKKQILDKAMQADAIKHQATLATIEQTGGQTRQLVQQATGQALAQGNQATNTLIESQNVGHNATMLSEDAGAAAAENPVNISRAAGKTLAGLGWWGIPLVAVVTALLNALLQAALGSSSSKSSSSSSSSTSDATKLKLVSNMLTYDAGNIQHFIGQDGRVYAASVEPAPRDGLITHPIATTVQGQPALVAEKGPEIVLGRETTRAIMMNEPELIRYLANYQQHAGRRLFDEGTPTPAATIPAGFPSGSGIVGEDARTLIAAIATFNRTVEQMQQKGIPCYINKYGSGGLIDEVKSGLKFDQRYGG